MKLAVVIMSDPKNGSEESLGRALNAMALAYEHQSAGDEVALLFKGAGTRWPEQLTQLGHPANGLYNLVRENVRGASCACAERYGAAEGVKASGVPLISDTQLPGTSGVLGLRQYLAEGWQTVVF
ncbi:MAG TPA: DsrE family protein [Acidovorax sp.]|nr:DsrE family protein [Acidovorax sp.]